MKHTGLGLSFGLAVIGSFGGSARAATLSYSADIPAVTYASLTGAATTTVSASQLSFSVPITQFDPSLGVLNSVTDAFNVQYELTFGTGTSGGQNQFGFNTYLTLGGAAFDFVSNGSGGGGAPGQPFDLKVPITSAKTFDLGYGAAQNAIGTGMTPFGVEYSDDVVVDSFAGSTALFERDAGSVTISYDYTPAATPAATPLPQSATAGLTLLGLLGVARLRRRRPLSA